MTNTLTWSFKPIQLPKLNTNLLIVISLIVMGATLSLIASSIVSADSCLSKLSDLMDAAEALESAQADHDDAVAEWEEAPWWKKPYYWTRVLYYRAKLEIASRKHSKALEDYLSCTSVCESDSGGCDSNS